MGDRAQVLIVQEHAGPGVFLYTHWQGSEIIDIVKKALRRKQRWDNPEYLARIIFDEMKGSDTDSETGYGIGLFEHGDIHTLVVVNTGGRTVIPNRHEPNCRQITFEEFIA